MVKEHILRAAFSPHFELSGSPVISQKTDYVRCLKSQYDSALCLSSCAAGNIPIPLLLQYVVGRHLSILQ